MGSRAQKFMKGRGNKIAVKKSVMRGGKSFQQTYWVSPQEAETLARRKAAVEKKATREKKPKPQEESRSSVPSSGTLYHVAHFKELGELASSGLSTKKVAFGADGVRTSYKISDNYGYGEHGKDQVAEGTFPVVVRFARPQDAKQSGRVGSGDTRVPAYLAKSQVKPESLEFFYGGKWQPIEAWKDLDPSEAGDEQGYLKSEIRNPFYWEPTAAEVTEVKQARVEYEDAKARSELERGFREMGIDHQLVLGAYSMPEGLTWKIKTAEASGGYDYDLGKQVVSDVMIGGDIRNEDGVGMGKLWRSIKRVDGELKVKHHEFRLDKSLRDKGMGSKMILNQLEKYEEMGVEEVSLSAISVGKYYWMKLGFRPTGYGASQVTEHLQEFFAKDNTLSDEQEKAILSGSLTEFARMKGLPEVEYVGGDGETHSAPLNKAVLLGKDTPGWDGAIRRDNPSWEEAKKFLRGYIESKGS